MSSADGRVIGYEDITLYIIHTDSVHELEFLLGHAKYIHVLRSIDHPVLLGLVLELVRSITCITVDV